MTSTAPQLSGVIFINELYDFYRRQLLYLGLIVMPALFPAAGIVRLAVDLGD
jgi:hypothetical protein